MKRRKAREYALQLLFQFDFTGNKPSSDDFKEFWVDKGEDKEVIAFAEDITKGTLTNLAEIDTCIKNAAQHWIIKRMAAVDRNIMRCAVFEILFRKEIPPAVTINEFLEIAKKFSGKESASFINGILDKIAQNKNQNVGKI